MNSGKIPAREVKLGPRTRKPPIPLHSLSANIPVATWSDLSSKRPTSTELSEQNFSPKRLTTPEELAKQDVINKALSRLSKTRKGIITTRSEASISYGGDTTPLRSLSDSSAKRPTGKSIPQRTPEQSLMRQKARELGEMIQADEYWKSVSKTPEEYQSHLKKHAFNLSRKMQLMSEVPEEELNKIIGVEKMAVKKTVTKKTVKLKGGTLSSTHQFSEHVGSNLTPKRTPVEKDVGEEIMRHFQSQKGKKVNRTAEQAKEIQSDWNIRKYQREHDIHPKKFKGNVPKTAQVYGGQPSWSGSSAKRSTSLTSSGVPSSTHQFSEHVGSNLSPLRSKTANVVGRIAKSPIAKIAGKVLSHPIAKVAGRLLEAGALGASAYEVGKSGLELVGEVKRIINKPSKEYDETKFNEIIPSRSNIGLKTALPKISTAPEVLTYEQRVKDVEARKALARNQPVKPSGVDTKPRQIKQSMPSKLRMTPTRTNKISSTKPAMSTPLSSVVPKRPDQIKESLAFLHPLQSVYAPRVSPVKPIPTRIQMPEQFMSPSMSLASLPKINRYKLGISR